MDDDPRFDSVTEDGTENEHGLLEDGGAGAVLVLFRYPCFHLGFAYRPGFPVSPHGCHMVFPRAFAVGAGGGFDGGGGDCGPFFVDGGECCSGVVGVDVVAVVELGGDRFLVPGGVDFACVGRCFFFAVVVDPAE
ncbi:hypothetical protein [Corynebacterium provencense]|uniref:hypothetical protein n=1 Tax=Corynebacterium provencense TaxID=1737425 RepID=UPI0021C28C3E|nr:hypothetical protein [Corynebacterium provencense]